MSTKGVLGACTIEGHASQREQGMLWNFPQNP